VAILSPQLHAALKSYRNRKSTNTIQILPHTRYGSKTLSTMVNKRAREENVLNPYIGERARTRDGQLQSLRAAKPVNIAGKPKMRTEHSTPKQGESKRIVKKLKMLGNCSSTAASTLNHAKSVSREEASSSDNLDSPRVSQISKSDGGVLDSLISGSRLDDWMPELPVCDTSADEFFSDTFFEGTTIDN